MAVLPSVPDPIQDFGLPKNNYDDDGVIDPETEVPYDEYEAMAVCHAAGGRTGKRALVHVKFTGGAPAIEWYDSMWGNDVAVQPGIADNGVGDTTLTWAAAGYNDLNPTPARRVRHAPAFKHAQVTPIGSTPYIVSVDVTTNTVRVYTTTHAGGAADVDFYLEVR